MHPAYQRLMHVRRRSRSRSPPSGVKSEGPLGNSASGSRVKRCGGCVKARCLTRETIRNGLRIIRAKYGIPRTELPELSPDDLGRYHLFLLEQGKERASVPFPRRLAVNRQSGDGLCSLQRLRRHERWEFALSVASIKRNLPAGCAVHTPSEREHWVSHALSNPDPLPAEYLAHVRRVAAQVFPSGWDKNYYSFVREHVPNSTAREVKLSRADHLWMGRREEFLNATTSEWDLAPTVFGARYKEVMSAGKKRPLVIYDERVDLLGPLHKCLYSHLRRSDWLLCGPPTEKRVASVCTGEYQTSVDLVSASDGLYHSVAEVLLDVAFFGANYIPRSLRSLAKASLKPLVDLGNGERRAVTHGQMMGAYLCFPLLCLQSYCAATWATRKLEGARYLVNGDDTVISASRGVSVEDYPPGFRLNDRKSIRAKNVVEVNSTVFLKIGGKWREVRHLRRGGAATDYEGMMHMAKAVASRPCWVSAFVRARIGGRWGFLPSQIDLNLTYPAYLRERSLLSRRKYTALPEPPALRDDRLVRIVGRSASLVEAEKLRNFLWENGRGKARKRDVWNPSPGTIRRTYCYRSAVVPRPFNGRTFGCHLSFGAWVKECHASTVKKREYFLPEGEYSDEEECGLLMLDLWRQAFDSLAQE